MPDALIGLGGNIGDARAVLNEAVRRLCDGDAVTLIARSSDYRTPPWGVADQAPFINACLRVATTLTPRGLLNRALEVEAALGRDRAAERRWGPRTIDIDILAYDDLYIDEPGLRLPHLHLSERAFVLAPLAAIAPERVISGQTVRAMAARIDTTGIERLP
jgi:2-amino-4-hydroxy-6-hydroxymethyldihydropteridine diphosphokinase